MVNKVSMLSMMKRTDQPDPYPWLDGKDPRRHMTDEEILWKYIDLKDSALDED